MKSCEHGNKHQQQQTQRNLLMSTHYAQVTNDVHVEAMSTLIFLLHIYTQTHMLRLPITFLCQIYCILYVTI